METFKNFDSFVCIGDTRTVEVDGLRVVATVHADTDTEPTDFDCYETKDIEAWRNDEWQFVGIVLSVYAGDILLAGYAVSLWGIDANFPDSDNAYLTEIANELIPEAVSVGKAKVLKVAAIAA